MDKKMKKILSLFLSIPLTLSSISMPVYAAPNTEPVPEEETSVDEGTTEKESDDVVVSEDTATENNRGTDSWLSSTDFDWSKFGSNSDWSNFNVNSTLVDQEEVENTEIDSEDPAIAAVSEELSVMTVTETDEETGEETTVALTAEQIQTIVYLFGQYQDQWKNNANLLGVQTPFFLSFNDNEEDGLGILGEMLVLAGYTVDDVRNGNYKYDDLVGMIQNFYYADKFALEYYSEDIIKSRDEVLTKVDNSGAKTFVQKMLVINDWLAHNATFDMSYIMQDEDGNPIMVAENPVKHEHYDEIYDQMYDLYYDQIEKQFHDQIYDGIVANLRQQYYEGAIKQIVIDSYKSQVENQFISSFKEENPEATDEEAKAAAEAYMDEHAEEIEENASAQAEQFMEENADAISEDALGFIKTTFGEKAATQIEQGCNAFIEGAKTDGIAVGKDEEGNDIVQTVEQMTQYAMASEAILDLNGDGENETTANDAIPIFAQKAATGLTQGIIGAWEGNHVGVLAEGYGVCAGYAKAFAYLLQYMSPEIYGVDGANTDMSKAENWKKPEDLYYDEEGNIDIDNDYLVDLVRITFDANVSMFGEESPFGEVHFWNAVKVDGQWYYVDPCYTDIYVECMSRDRVEIDGTMNHMYFMFSHSTATEMYDGNMKEITTLYADVATDTSYEDSWYARIASNAYSDGDNFYYSYDSTDMLSMMREFQNMQGSQGDFDASDFESLMEAQDPTYKIVYHPITDTDVVEGKDADSDFVTLIDFNYKENEDDETSVARVYDPATDTMVENELLTQLFAQYKDECEIYPSIKLTTALYDGQLYFNLSNCIFSYNLSTGEVLKVKEYNTVSAVCDTTNAFRGMAYTVTDDVENADLTVKNHPIAAMTIKDDGQMYVSIATNFGFISGKNAVNDTEHYGYAYEESNYNPDYSSYMQDSDYDDEQLEEMGYSREKNDNDEFMWSAVFVDKINLKAPCTEHTYETVIVDPYCGHDGFTEERCSECGAIKEDSRIVDEGSACEHHYVHFDETYYTKDSNGNWNTGDCYVCTVCGFAISEPTEPTKNAQESDEDYQERVEEYEKEKAIWDNAVETAGHTYAPVDPEWSEDSTSVTFTELECTSVCPERHELLDCLLDDDSIHVTLEAEFTADAEITDYEGNCAEGVTAIFTATGEAEGHPFTATNEVEQEAGQHTYTGKFTWSETLDDEGQGTGEYTAKADLTCEICGDKHDGVEAVVVLDEEKSTEPSCDTEGKVIYTATATVTDEDGNVLGSASESKVMATKAALGHQFTGEFTWTEIEDGYTAVATISCDVCDTVYEDVEAEVVLDEENSVAASCKVGGTNVYVATATVTDDEGEVIASVTDSKEVEVPALGHNYVGVFTWTETDDEPTAKAVMTCTRCEDTQTVDAVVEFVSHEDPTCEKAGKDVYKATATARDTEGNALGSDSETKEFSIPATGHQYEDGKCIICGADEHQKVTEVFSDVNEDDWFVDAVQYVYNRGIMTGDSGQFNPYGAMTRAMMVTTLYRLEGCPEVTNYEASELFSDIEKDAWYTDAVNWAYNEGITTGYTDIMKFGPYDNVTREQLAVFFYRYAEMRDYDVSGRADITGYVGYDKISDYAIDAMSWAVDAGIISGVESTDSKGQTIYDLDPKGDATRAQLATILMRFCEKYDL